MSEAKVVLVPGGFWIRVLAAIIDSVILGVVQMIVIKATDSQILQGQSISWTYLGVSMLFQGTYAGAMYRYKGATLGKMALSLQVVDHRSGDRISFLRGFFRDVIGKWVDALAIGIGFLMAAFTKEKRTLHDFIFDTRVVRKTAVVEFPAEAIKEEAV